MATETREVKELRAALARSENAAIDGARRVSNLEKVNDELLRVNTELSKAVEALVPRPQDASEIKGLTVARDDWKARYTELKTRYDEVYRVLETQSGPDIGPFGRRYPRFG